MHLAPFMGRGHSCVSSEERVQRLILLTAGLICLTVGFFTFWLPIPVGLVLMVIGLALLLSSSPWLVARVRAMRKANPGLNRRLRVVARRLPGPLRLPLARTDTAARVRRAVRRHMARRPVDLQPGDDAA